MCELFRGKFQNMIYDFYWKRIFLHLQIMCPWFRNFSCRIKGRNFVLKWIPWRCKKEPWSRIATFSLICTMSYLRKNRLRMLIFRKQKHYIHLWTKIIASHGKISKTFIFCRKLCQLFLQKLMAAFSAEKHPAEINFSESFNKKEWEIFHKEHFSSV